MACDLHLCESMCVYQRERERERERSITFLVSCKGSGVFFDPHKVESPGNKEEILQIVRYAIENRQKLRVLGSGHSRSKIALSDDIIVSLHRFKGVTKLNKQTKQVREREREHDLFCFVKMVVLTLLISLLCEQTPTLQCHIS